MARTIAVCLAGLSVILVYAEPLAGLVRDWLHDDNQSHGLLIIPAAAWMVWRDRATLRGLPRRPRTIGLVAVMLGVAILFAGTLGAELFLTRTSMLVVLAGIVLFLLGMAHLRRLAFPLAFLLLMIPLPAIIFNQIAFPLQLLASRLGVSLLGMGAIPVLREGNVIVLANTTLEVAEACSGIRSLESLLTLAILYGYLNGYGAARRILLAVATIPIAIVANALRVAGAGVSASLYGPEAVEGFGHTLSGGLLFVTSMLMLVGLDRLLSMARRRSTAPLSGVQVTA